MAERKAKKIKKAFAFSALKSSDGELDDGVPKGCVQIPQGKPFVEFEKILYNAVFANLVKAQCPLRKQDNVHRSFALEIRVDSSVDARNACPVILGRLGAPTHIDRFLHVPTPFFTGRSDADIDSARSCSRRIDRPASDP